MVANGQKLACGAMMAGALLVAAQPVQAQDFFSALFGGFGGHSRAPQISLPFTGDAPPLQDQRPRVASVGRQAYCVRTCDGRYFPITAGDNQTRAASCNSFCPASETKVVYGGDIDSAVTESGKPYSELPNAFKYRTALVPGCSCNGKDPAGLASVDIKNDPTLRKGDIVAGADGLMVAGRGDKRGAALNMSPAPQSVAAKFERPAVLARE